MELYIVVRNDKLVSIHSNYHRMYRLNYLIHLDRIVRVFAKNKSELNFWISLIGLNKNEANERLKND